MERAFDIAWALCGVIGIAASLLLRWRLVPLTKSGVARDLAVLSIIVFLVFPIISIADDIGYFNYYFSPGEAPDGIIWLKASRRDKQCPLSVGLQAFALSLPATSTLCRRAILGTVTPAAPVPLASRRVAAASLRAPPAWF